MTAGKRIVHYSCLPHVICYVSGLTSMLSIRVSLRLRCVPILVLTRSIRLVSSLRRLGRARVLHAYICECILDEVVFMTCGTCATCINMRVHTRWSGCHGDGRERHKPQDLRQHYVNASMSKLVPWRWRVGKVWNFPTMSMRFLIEFCSCKDFLGTWGLRNVILDFLVALSAPYQQWRCYSNITRTETSQNDVTFCWGEIGVC